MESASLEFGGSSNRSFNLKEGFNQRRTEAYKF